MSLAQRVSSYLASWEGHTQNEGDQYIWLRTILSTATNDELSYEYNALTYQRMWRGALLNLFYDELLQRLKDGTMFEFIQTPDRQIIRIGMEDFYTPDSPIITMFPDEITLFTSEELSPPERDEIFNNILQRNITGVVYEIDPYWLQVEKMYAALKISKPVIVDTPGRTHG